MGHVKELAIADLQMDQGLQLRARIDQEHVERLAEAYATETAAEKVPPIGVLYDSKQYWVWDGNHRILGRTRAGLDTIPCHVEAGTRKDAVLKAAGANHNHGLPRSKEDKRLAVRALLADKTWAKRSDRWIAETCRVSRGLVADVREAVAAEVDRESRVQERTRPVRKVAEWPPGEQEADDEAAEADENDGRIGRDGKRYKERKRTEGDESPPEEAPNRDTGGLTPSRPPATAKRPVVYGQAEAAAGNALRTRLVLWLQSRLAEDERLTWQIISDELAALAVECRTWEA